MTWWHHSLINSSHEEFYLHLTILYKIVIINLTECLCVNMLEHHRRRRRTFFGRHVSSKALCCSQPVCWGGANVYTLKRPTEKCQPSLYISCLQLVRSAISADSQKKKKKKIHSCCPARPGLTRHSTGLDWLFLKHSQPFPATFTIKAPCY